MFNTKTEWRVLLTVWESCPSNCFNCSSREAPKKYYSYKDLRENILFIWENFTKNFECLLFFTDAIYHPDIVEFVSDPILSNFDTFTLQIHPVYNDKFETIVPLIIEKNPQVVFHICNFYLNSENVDSIIYFFQNITKYNTLFDMDLFFDFKKYRSEMETMLRMFPWKISSWIDPNNKKTYKLEYKNIEINFYFQAEQRIFSNQNYISNVHFKDCISYTSFNILWEEIYVDEEVMIQPDGTITFHRNTLCSKAIQKISHIKKDKYQILKDFLSLKDILLEYNSWDMWKNCFECIHNKVNI